VSSFKVGDKVWVLCEVTTKAKNPFGDGSPKSTAVVYGPVSFRAMTKDCRPVEPPVVKDSFTTESNSPKILDSSSDTINPSHYKHLPAEAIDIIMAAIAKAPSNQSAFLQGQVIKYLLRCWSKKGIEDLKKAKWYLDRLIGGFDDLLAEASGANDGRIEVGE